MILHFKTKQKIMQRGCIFSLFMLCFVVSFTPSLKAHSATNSIDAIEQQGHAITGIVVDLQGEPIIGASVVTEDKKHGTMTDLDGIFKLDVPVGTKLVVSFIGFDTQTIEARNENMRITMTETQNVLGEVQVVAYGAQKKVTVTGAISSVNGNELLRTPTSSVTNVLSGMVTGLSSIQNSGEPGSDAARLLVRGKGTWLDSSPLIQVDGVERSFSDIDPNEIESITVLKDASATAVFGVRGANGVILITTKRGEEGKTKISFSTSASILTPTKTIEKANAYEYAMFYNQMRRNDGAEPVFADEVLQKFKNHSDPIRFPDTDWIDYILKSATFQSQHNVNISGGTKTVRYFVSAGAHTQGGLFKEFDLPYDLTYQYNRFNYRSNLDIDVTKTTTLSINLSGTVDNAHRPYTRQESSGMMKNIYWATPFSSPGLIDGKMVNAATDYSDVKLPFTGGTGMAYYGGGFMQSSNNKLVADVTLNQKLNFLIKGLSFRIKGSYNSNFIVYKNGKSSIATYTPVLQADGSLAYRKSGENSQIKYEEIKGIGRNWYMETGMNYDRDFGDHHVGALFLYNQSKEYYPKLYPEIPHGYVGLVGRVLYDWKNRYMAEFNIGYNGSENFAKDKRFGTFPAGSIGWTVSEESFWAPVKPVVDYMKLRVSMGLVGNDKISDARFMYIPDPYNVGNDTSPNKGGFGYYFGVNNPTLSKGAYEKAKNNPDVTWEKAFKQNYGVDLSFIGGNLKTSFDYFRERRKDILLSDGTAPGILGFVIPRANMGKMNSWGWELSVKWDDKVGSDFRYWAGVNLSYNQNEIKEMKEAPQNNAYQYKKGHRVGANKLYKFWRFYDEDTPKLYEENFGTPFPDHGVRLKPGDAVFVDLNGDGKIDSQDESFDYGHTEDPEYAIGLNMGFNWKRFDVSMQWAGGYNVSRVISDVFRQPFVSGNGNTEGGLLKYHLKHTWTEENPSQDAAYPRATWVNGTNNYSNSTLFEADASYLRLKTLQVAYSFDMPFMKKLKLNSCILAFSGYNLITFTDYKWGDPEARASNAPSYPLTRSYTLSLKLGF